MWELGPGGWEPPLAGTEAEHLVGALDRLRTTFRWKADDLDAAELQARVGPSSLTLGGLLKHLARAEEQMFSTKLSGAPLGAPWDTPDWDSDPDWDFNSAAGDTPEDLYALWDGTVERSRAKYLGTPYEWLLPGERRVTVVIEPLRVRRIVGVEPFSPR